LSVEEELTALLYLGVLKGGHVAFVVIFAEFARWFVGVDPFG